MNDEAARFDLIPNQTISKVMSSSFEHPESIRQHINTITKYESFPKRNSHERDYQHSMSGQQTRVYKVRTGPSKASPQGWKTVQRKAYTLIHEGDYIYAAISREGENTVERSTDARENVPRSEALATNKDSSRAAQSHSSASTREDPP